MFSGRNFSRFFFSHLTFFFGLLPSIAFANCDTTNQDDPRHYTLCSKYFRLTAPKRQALVIQAVDSRYPDCNYRKVQFCLEEYHHQFYGRLGANGSQLNVDELSSNEASASISAFGLTTPINLPRGTFKTSNASTTASGAEIAIGYLWCDIRAEAELLFNTKTDASAIGTINPIPLQPPFPIDRFPPNPISAPISVQLQTQTYLGNIYYDFMISERIRPFLTCGLGLSINTLSLAAENLFDIQSVTKRTYNLAYALGLGIRVGIFANCFVTTSYRYMRLGTATTETSPATIQALGLANVSIPPIRMNNADLYQNTFSVGLMYLF